LKPASCDVTDAESMDSLRWRSLWEWWLSVQTTNQPTTGSKYSGETAFVSSIYSAVGKLMQAKLSFYIVVRWLSVCLHI